MSSQQHSSQESTVTDISSVMSQSRINSSLEGDTSFASTDKIITSNEYPSNSIQFDSIDDYIKQTRQMLTEEGRVEKQKMIGQLTKLSPRELQRMGLALLYLKTESIQTGLYGRILITFCRNFPQHKQYRRLTTKKVEGETTIDDGLPLHRFTPGDIAFIYKVTQSFEDSPLARSVVHHVEKDKMTLAIEADDERSDGCLNWNKLVHVTLGSSGVTIKKQHDVLVRMKECLMTRGLGSSVLDVCFNKRDLHFDYRPIDDVRNSKICLTPKKYDKKNLKELVAEDLKCLNFFPHLNTSQKEAVILSQRAMDVFCIHGPPGTGKTTTLVECIKEFARQGKRVLACAPSNVAVDNLLEKCLLSGVKDCIRIGHPSRVSESLSSHCFDYMVRHSPGYVLCKDIELEISNELRSLQELNAQRWKGLDYFKYQERKRRKRRSQFKLRDLRKEFRYREKKAIEDTLLSAQLVFTTCIGADEQSIFKIVTGSFSKVARPFDVVCIDEAAQALEVSSWIPALLGKKLLLAGDHRQLPPTIKSKTAAKILGFTLFQRLLQMYNEQVSHMLTTQYRMHQSIMNWSGEVFYDAKLIADESAKLRDLKSFVSSTQNSMDGIADGGSVPSPITWIDTSGCIGCYEDDDFKASRNESDLFSMSKTNKFESVVVVKYLEHLLQVLKVYINKEQIKFSDLVGIITPYNAQVKLIQSCLVAAKSPELHDVVTKTVDGFQGKEKEIILISLVRSNINKTLGFLSDHRRLNVAVTRAKRHVAIVGNSETISSDPVLKGLYNSALENGEVLSADTFVAPKDIPLNELEASKNKKMNTSQKSKKVISNMSGQKSGGNHKRGDDLSNQSKKKEEVLSQKYTRILSQLKERGGSHTFSSQLTSYKRQLIHKIAESLNLQHKSIGEGRNRQIIVSVVSTEAKNSQTSQTLDTETDSAIRNKNVDEISEMESFQANTNRFALFEESTQSEATEKQSSFDEIEKKKILPVIILKEEKKTKGDDSLDDRLLDLQLKNKWKCEMTKCPKSTELLGQVCLFCKNRFCFSHILPEIHGCGHEAKRNAKKQFRNTFKANRDGAFLRGGKNNNNNSSQWRVRKASTPIENT